MGALAQTVLGASVTVATALFTNDLPPPSLKSEVEDRSARRPLPLRRAWTDGTERGRTAASTPPRTSRRDLGGPGRAAHRRDQDAAGEYERRVIGFFDKYLRVKSRPRQAHLHRSGVAAVPNNSKGDRDE